MRDSFDELFGRWGVVATDPQPFLSTVCGRRPGWSAGCRRSSRRSSTRRSTATTSATWTCAATTCAFATGAPCSSTGTGSRWRTRSSTWRRGCRACRSRAARALGGAAGCGRPGGVRRGRVGGGRRPAAAGDRAVRARRCSAHSSPSRSTGSTASSSRRLAQTVGVGLELGRVQADLAGLEGGLHLACERQRLRGLILVEHGAERRDDRVALVQLDVDRRSACACPRCTGRRGPRPRP